MSEDCTSFDSQALVFKVRSSTGPQPALFAGASIHQPADAAWAVAEYAIRNADRGARLSPLYSSGPSVGSNTGGWMLAVHPPAASPIVPSGVNYLRLASPADAPMLRDALERDPTVEYVHAPVLFDSLPSISTSSKGTTAGWDHLRCGFHKVWPILDMPGPFGDIAIIDNGNFGLDNHELDGRVTEISPASGIPSFASHASAVAGHITAHRNPVPGDWNPSVDGCCSAHVRVYNVWNAVGTALEFNYEAFHAALEQVAADQLPVLNLSISARCIDATSALMIQKCIDRGVVVVAAMGDYGEDEPKRFPAGLPNVVAVGATSIGEDWANSSCVGDHVFLAAPGEAIWTVAGDSPRFVSGTSFSTAAVSAAVWLARKHDPSMTVPQVHDLLRKSVDTDVLKRASRRKVGNGRLDVVKMAQALGHQIPTSPA